MVLLYSCSICKTNINFLLRNSQLENLFNYSIYQHRKVSGPNFFRRFSRTGPLIHYVSCISTCILPFVKNHPEMIIILAEGQRFNSSWDKPQPAKNATALPRARWSRFTCSGAGQRLAGQPRAGSSSPTLRAVSSVQTCTGAHRPHCASWVDLYLGLLLGGSQPCPGRGAVASNEASSLSCPVNSPEWQRCQLCLPHHGFTRFPRAPSEPAPRHSRCFCRMLGTAEPCAAAGSLAGHQLLRQLLGQGTVPWQWHTGTGPAALSELVSAGCMEARLAGGQGWVS